MRTRRPPADQYAEIAFARLVNDQVDRGFTISRLPGREDGAWIVSIGGRPSHTASTIAEAVEAAIRAAAS